MKNPPLQLRENIITPSSGVEEQQHRHPCGFTPPHAQSHATRFIVTLLT